MVTASPLSHEVPIPDATHALSVTHTLQFVPAHPSPQEHEQVSTSHPRPLAHSRSFLQEPRAFSAS